MGFAAGGAAQTPQFDDFLFGSSTKQPKVHVGPNPLMILSMKVKAFVRGLTFVAPGAK